MLFVNDCREAECCAASELYEYPKAASTGEEAPKREEDLRDHEVLQSWGGEAEEGRTLNERIIATPLRVVVDGKGKHIINL